MMNLGHELMTIIILAVAVLCRREKKVYILVVGVLLALHWR